MTKKNESDDYPYRCGDPDCEGHKTQAEADAADRAAGR